VNFVFAKTLYDIDEIAVMGICIFSQIPNLYSLVVTFVFGIREDPFQNPKDA